MPPLFSGGNSGVLRRSTDVCELRTADFSESWVCEQAIEETRDSGFDSLASGQIALRWRIRKARVHEPGVEPLRILAAEIVRSRPPTEALGSSDHGARLEDAHAEPKQSRGASATRHRSAELGLLPEFVTCRVDGVKWWPSPPSPQRCSSGSPGVTGGGRGTFARCPPRDEAASTASRRRHRLCRVTPPEAPSTRPAPA